MSRGLGDVYKRQPINLFFRNVQGNISDTCSPTYQFISYIRILNADEARGGKFTHCSTILYSFVLNPFSSHLRHAAEHVCFYEIIRRIVIIAHDQLPRRLPPQPLQQPCLHIRFRFTLLLTRSTVRRPGLTVSFVYPSATSTVFAHSGASDSTSRRRIPNDAWWRISPR